MAAEGIRFTQAYAGCTVCAPSRSAFMTGYYTGQTRVRGNGRNEQVLRLTGPSPRVLHCTFCIWGKSPTFLPIGLWSIYYGMSSRYWNRKRSISSGYEWLEPLTSAIDAQSGF